MTRIFPPALAAAAALAAAGAMAQEAPGPDWARAYFREGGAQMPACGICHALSAAGTTGAVGPDLDELQPDAGQVRAAVTDGVGVMPAFGPALSEAQITAIAEYVAAAVR